MLIAVELVLSMLDPNTPYYLGAVFACLALVFLLFPSLRPKQDGPWSVQVGTALPGEGVPRRHCLYHGALLASPPHMPEGKTLADTFDMGYKLNPHGNCLGTRKKYSDGTFGEYQWLSYEEVNAMVNAFGSGLHALGVKAGDKVGLYSKNRAEWQIAGLACNRFSFVSVALYDTLGEEAREYVITHAEVKALVFSPDMYKNVAMVAKACPGLKVLVSMDGTEKMEGVKSLNEVIELGKTKNIAPVRPSGSDLAVIMYTSGTTGMPKGVMITHANALAAVAGNDVGVPTMDSSDVYFSYLPLAHIFERICDEAIFCHGAAIGYFSGDIRQLAQDIAALRPTILPGVPKVYDRFVSVVKSKVEAGSPIARFLFAKAYAAKRAALIVGSTTPIWDALVFKKTKAALGGRLKFMITGAAPMSADTMEFLRIVFCAPILQGYAMTESACSGALTDYRMLQPAGKVGGPSACMEIKLVDTADGMYKSSNTPPTGEVCFHSPAVTLGYYKDEAKTAEVYKKDKNGKLYLHTGDVGRWNPDGSLSIIGRTKDIFKLSQGEYIAPEKVENVMMGSKYLSQCFVYGDSFHDYLVACVVPDVAEITALADKLGIKYTDKPKGPAPDCPPSLCQNKQIIEAIEAALKDSYAEAKLAGFEKPKKIKISPEFWMPGELMTPTFKNKRPQLLKHFRADIDSMY